MGSVLSFDGAMRRRIESASVKAGLNSQTVTLSSGATVKQWALPMSDVDRRLLAAEREFGPYFNDSQVSGAPLRVIKLAWENYRAALNLIGVARDLTDVRVRYSGEHGDCHGLMLMRGEVALGELSILDGAVQRSSTAIHADLRRLLAS